MIEWIQSIDEAVLLFLQENVRAELLTPVMKFFSLLGKAGAVWIVLGLALLFFRKTRKSGFCVLVCMAVVWLLGDGIIKPLLARPRPYDTMETLVALSRESSFSFPSGHSSIAFCSATSLTVTRGKKAALLFIPAAIIAFSRLYLGVHYPSDVLCGCILGAGLALLLTWLILRYFDGPVSRFLKVEHGL